MNKNYIYLLVLLFIILCILVSVLFYRPNPGKISIDQDFIHSKIGTLKAPFTLLEVDSFMESNNLLVIIEDGESYKHEFHLIALEYKNVDYSKDKYIPLGDDRSVKQFLYSILIENRNKENVDYILNYWLPRNWIRLYGYCYRLFNT